jgi:hypothetical protein
MKCINHDNVDAVGICKYCGRAICKQCILQNDLDVIVCSQKCLDEVTLGQDMVEKAKVAYGLKPGRIPVNMILYFVFGAILFFLGLLIVIGGKSTGYYLIVPGVLFFIMGCVYYYNQKNSGMRV